jgi:ankyrin repeat protein
MLLENGADPDTIGIEKLGEPVLFEIVESIDLPDEQRDMNKMNKTRMVAELLIEHGANVNHATRSGETPLYKAAGRGRTDLCELFSENGAEIDAADMIGLTPLYWAAYYGYWETAQFLLENGAQPNIRNNIGRTILSYAEERTEEEFLQEVRKDFKNYRPGTDYDKTIEVLKQYGAE